MLPTEPLIELLLSIQKQINNELILGSGNKETDLKKTNNWSGAAIDYARTQVTHFKTIFNQTKPQNSSSETKTSITSDFHAAPSADEIKSDFHAAPSADEIKSDFHAAPSADEIKFESSVKYLPEFNKMKKIPFFKNNAMPFAFYGSYGLAARAGNCQECVGLAIYHLINPNQKRYALKIEIMEMDDCFDHVFLRISLPGKSFYFDPWMRKIYPSNDPTIVKTHLLETATAIKQGLEIETKEATDPEEKNEIDKMISQCEKFIKQKKINVSTLATLNTKDFAEYLENFEKNYNQELNELYPQKNPNPFINKS